MLYYNYHKHDHKGNIRSLDVITKLEDYCKRAIVLGHNAIFTTNHGMQGDIFEATTLAHEYNLKLIVGCECYYVDDRHEKDRSNKHIIIIALNNSGVKELNKMLSKANEDGYYYKPRIDKSLLMQLNPNNFIITTACVAGILKDENLVLELYAKFKDNFLIETQNHNEDIQRDFSKLAIRYNEKYGIKMIHGNDSHYINPEDSKYRELFLKAKGIIYENENEFILDYPDSKTIVARYKKQGILNDEQIKQTLQNTLIFDKAESITLINDDIKLPSISSNPNKELKKIISKAWKEEKKNVSIDKHEEYEEAIKYEMDIIQKTHMEDYFIIDTKIVERGQNVYGGKLTNTGRGSAPSFYNIKLLGLTNIDRLVSPCKLFPTRFMSVERILGARSLPDIDLNTADKEPFVQATKDLLGEDNCAWMIAYKPLQRASGFRLYCKAIGLNVSEYDMVAKNLDNYIGDEYWNKIIEDSKPFIGVIESISESPCSMVLYDKNVAEHIGMIKIKDKFCCLLDGYNCDKYKYLKNDYLTVTIWSIIKQVCDMVKIPIPTIKELDELLDDKTYDIYKNGLTCTINQADSDWATSLVKKYHPKSVSEVSQFVAMIRPGCASLLSDFIARQPYTTGVKALDNILEDSEHRLIYQESIMKYLIWLGISESHSYDIIKKIAKKKFKGKELEELKTELKEGWMKQVKIIEGFEATWTVVEQASKYSFNASHSLSYAYDSLYGAYLKSHFPLEYYSIVLNEYSGDSDRTTKLVKELDFFNIKIENPKFRYSKGEYTPDKNTNTIYKGVGSLKYLNESCANQLYNLRNNKYKNFIEVLRDITLNVSINSRQLSALISLDYFSEFGKSKRLLEIYDKYTNLTGRKQFKKSDLASMGLTEDIMHKYSKKVTEKIFKDVDIEGLIEELTSNIEDKDIKLKDKIDIEIEYIGYPVTTIDQKDLYYVIKIDEFKNKKSITRYLTMYNLNNGDNIRYKLSDFRLFAENPIIVGNIIKIISESKKAKKKQDNDGKWHIVEGEFNNSLDAWEVY